MSATTGNTPSPAPKVVRITTPETTQPTVTTETTPVDTPLQGQTEQATPIVQPPVVTVEDIIATGNWSGAALDCVNALRQLEPTYFADVATAKVTVAELQTYATPCSLLAGNTTNGYSTNGLWTRSKYNIDQQLAQ